MLAAALMLLKGEIIVGEIFTLELPCSPTTGYRWELKSIDRKIAVPGPDGVPHRSASSLAERAQGAAAGTTGRGAERSRAMPASAAASAALSESSAVRGVPQCVVT